MIIDAVRNKLRKAKTIAESRGKVTSYDPFDRELEKIILDGMENKIKADLTRFGKISNDNRKAIAS